MGIRFDATADVLTSTINLPTITSFSAMGWFRFVAFPTSGNFCYAINLGRNPVGGYGFGVQNASGTSKFNGWNETADASGSNLSLNTWYHMAMTCAGTGAGQFLCYLNGVLDITMAGNASALSEKLWLGNNYYTEFADARIAAVKIYSGAVLTAAEISSESRQYCPVRFASLNRWTPLFGAGDLSDFSANANPWTGAGTPTTEEGPPIPWKFQKGKRMPYVVSAAGVAFGRRSVYSQAVRRAASY